MKTALWLGSTRHRSEFFDTVPAKKDHVASSSAAAGAISQERPLELLIDAVTDYAIYMLDPSGIVASWNAGARRIKGYDAVEIIGAHFSRFFTEEDRLRGAPDHALDVARRTGRFESEGWRLRKDGSRFWALAVIEAIRREDGGLIGFAKVTRDMTERRQAQQALIDSERSFRLLVAGVSDYSIFMLDPDGIVSNWNLGAERIKGYRADEIVGQHFSRFYAEADRAAGLPERGLAAARTEGRYEAEGWRVRKDGTRFWASVVIDAIRDEAGQPIGFAKITRDITEKRNTAIALEKAREQLAQVQKLEAIGQLTGGVAHDFNNLLMVISGRLEILQQKELGAEILADITAIERAVHRGESLTRQLLTFARRQALRPTSISLRQWLPRLLEMLRPSLRGDIELRMQVADDVWPIEVDANELEFALINLAVNARDAMPSGGRVTITMTNEELAGSDAPDGLAGSFVRIAVSDTGQGIPAELQSRVFEPFFTTKEIGKGTGLGLAQVYGFAMQSGGTVNFTSREGEGTTVAIFLPRAGSSALEPSPEPAVSDAERNPATILLVEDNDEVAEVTVEMLRGLGHAIRRARTGAEALDLLAKGGRCDLVISDILMPGRLSGIELAGRLAADPDGPPVLLVTGYSSAASQAAEKGLTILPKPFPLRTLDQAIRRKLGRTTPQPAGMPGV
jgi:PAS domain S-box-containing protein